MILMIGIGFIVLAFLAPVLGVVAGIVLPALLSVICLIGGLLLLGAFIGYVIRSRKEDDDK